LQRPSISIVIPAYNESARISKALGEVLRVVRERAWNAEVLVVNDGSTDRTAAIVAEFAQVNPEVRLLNNRENRGKGFSVRHGVLNAVGEIVTGLLYVDPNPRDLHAHLKTVDTPLNQLDDAALVPGAKALEAINASLR